MNFLETVRVIFPKHPSFLKQVPVFLCTLSYMNILSDPKLISYIHVMPNILYHIIAAAHQRPNGPLKYTFIIYIYSL